MRLDNSAFSAYMRCPQLYYERYEAIYPQLQELRPLDIGQSGRDAGPMRDLSSGVESLHGDNPADSIHAGSALPIIQPVTKGSETKGIELDEPSEGLDFGTRMHQLLHERRLAALGKAFEPSKEWPDESIESEAQATLAAYEAHYIRDLEYLESERTHTIPMDRVCPACGGEGLTAKDGYGLQLDQRLCQECSRVFTIHELAVKLDAVVRYGDGTIGPFDTKTEGRTGYNTREDWAGRTQAKIYLYALGALYPNEKVSGLTVDVVTRGSPKARRQPVFYRHDDIKSSPLEIAEAIRNVNYVADRIEEHRKEGWWPANMNVCKRGWERCDFYAIHVLGRTSENLKKYRPAEPYLDT